MKQTLKTNIEDLLLNLVEKRGKHSKLWMYPKSESLKEAIADLLHLKVHTTVVDKFDDEAMKKFTHTIATWVRR